MTVTRILNIAAQAGNYRLVDISTATLNGLTNTVANTKVMAQSLIIPVRQTVGGTIGTLSVGTISAGVNFQILSTNILDTSTVTYQVWNPLS